jgi:hypothetical protein
MRCRIFNADGISAIVCGDRPRRRCDICDRSASGPREQLRDGTRFDGCTTCRGRIAMARTRRENGYPPIDREWFVDAERKIRASLAGARS